MLRGQTKTQRTWLATARTRVASTGASADMMACGRRVGDAQPPRAKWRFRRRVAGRGLVSRTVRDAAGGICLSRMRARYMGSWPRQGGGEVIKSSLP